jgi:hypothetical protein
MRFVWITKPGTSLGAGSAERPSERERGLGHREIADQQADLQAYLDRFENKESIKESERAKFEQNLLRWDKDGEVESIRRAGVGAKDNEDDYLKRHELLSKSFLTKTPEPGFRFKVDFKGNNLAEWKVGAGDLLPPNVLTINLYRNGQVISGVRGRNPETGRIGYYEENALKRRQYDYVAVHTGDEIEITGTETVPPPGTRRILAEQIGVYQQGAASDSSSEGDEILYDAKTGRKYADKETALRERREQSLRQEKASIAELRTEVALPLSGDAIIEGSKYLKANRDFWNQEVGASETETKRWIAKEDPVSGGQLTFLGCPIPGGTNLLILPYLKEAESRIREAGIQYKIDQTSSTAWRAVRGSKTGRLSYHSWGAAIDLNPDQNKLGQTTTNIPPEVISIMESVGFRWGGRWDRPDPMHFEFKLNPYTAGGLLRSEDGKRYLAAAENFSRGRMEQYAKAMDAIRHPAEYALDPELNSKIEKNTETYASIIEAASKKYNVPANLIRAVIFQESGGDPTICSGVGAGGLMQLMPATAKGLGLGEIYPMTREATAKGKGRLRLDPRDERANPEKNINAGTQLLSQLLTRYDGNIPYALAGYNWGAGNMDKYLHGKRKMPRETQQYISSIPKMFGSLNKAGSAAEAVPEKGGSAVA